MKRLTAAILTACLSLSVMFSSAGAQSKVPSWIKVGLKFGGSAVSSAMISSDSGFDLTAKGGYTGGIAHLNEKSIGIAAVNSHYVVTGDFGLDYDSAAEYCKNSKAVVLYKKGSFYSVIENLYTDKETQAALSEARTSVPQAYSVAANGERLRLENQAGETLMIFAGDGGDSLAITSSSGYITYNGVKYRDFLEFKREGNGFDIISTIKTEHYLYGVVPSEIGGSSPYEALKAQAVCARTYLAKNIDKHKKNGFNICATTCCQTYSGMKNESENTNRAVDETAGEVITYDGEVISAVYSTSSGGQTADAESAWGAPIPYLLSVADPYSADYTWEYEIDYDKITDIMNSKGYGLGKIYSVSTTARGNDGRVTELTITGEKGEKKFLRESARTALGLKSQFYYIDNGKIIGRGYGHGVGMSQQGAIGLAKDGMGYKQIIKYYYTGVEIE